MLVKIETFPQGSTMRVMIEATNAQSTVKTVHMPPVATESEALAQALRYCTLEQERGEWSSLFGTRS